MSPLPAHEASNKALSFIHFCNFDIEQSRHTCKVLNTCLLNEQKTRFFTFKLVYAEVSILEQSHLACWRQKW